MVSKGHPFWTGKSEPDRLHLTTGMCTSCSLSSIFDENRGLITCVHVIKTAQRAPKTQIPRNLAAVIQKQHMKDANLVPLKGLMAIHTKLPTTMAHYSSMIVGSTSERSQTAKMTVDFN